MRIRSRLLLLVSAVLLPAVAVSAIGLAYLYKEERKFNRTTITETVRAMALALDREMARREAVLRALAGSPSLALGDLGRFHDFASKVAAEHDSAVILSDLDGRQLVNTRIPFGTRLPPMLKAERDNRARLGDEVTIISDVYLPPAGLGPHSFALQIPVRGDGGKVVLFLTMASFAGQMQNLLAEQRLPAGWHATIVDRQGVVVARSVEPEKFVGKPVREALGAKILASAEGVHDGVNLAGERSTAFFSRARGAGWVLLLAVPHKALYGPATRATVAMGALILLILGLGLAAALAVARHISRPVESLREAAERLGHSEPVAAQATGTVELDAVGQAMSQASARLRGTTAELERRVAQAVASFEQSQRALLRAQKLEALGRLTGGIAHDFNNVLQTLSAGLAVLKQRGAGSDPRDLLERCQRAVARGPELARQLMAFGRVQEVRAEVIDTAARLTEARHLLGGALPADVGLRYELADGLWPVKVDPAQFELALLNLVINARDAMPGGGRVVLSGRNEVLGGEGGELPRGEYVVLALADTGIGMSEEVMARALEPFYTTKGVGKGSGMGLAQAYGFARQNGGTVRLESRPGQGTTVSIVLPRAGEPLTPRAERQVSGLPAGKGRVLLVEDDDQVRGTVSTALHAAGFEVHTADTADAALQRLEGGERYDALLTDVVMPGKLNGLDLAAQVRRRYPRTGVVVVTGYSDRAVELPGVRALAKPFDVQQAVEALNQAMSSG